MKCLNILQLESVCRSGGAWSQIIGSADFTQIQLHPRGEILQRFSIFGKNEQFNTFRSFSVYLGQLVSAINFNCCWISGELLKWNHWYKINLVTGHLVVCDIVQQSAMAETSPRCSACWPTAVLQDESGRGLTNPSHNQQWNIHFHSIKTVAWTIL